MKEFKTDLIQICYVILDCVELLDTHYLYKLNVTLVIDRIKDLQKDVYIYRKMYIFKDR